MKSSIVCDRCWESTCVPATESDIDLADYIYDIENEITALQAENERLKAERNAAITDLRVVADCETCKFKDLDDRDEPCICCAVPEQRWQWRGLEARG